VIAWLAETTGSNKNVTVELNGRFCRKMNQFTCNESANRFESRIGMHYQLGQFPKRKLLMIIGHVMFLRILFLSLNQSLMVTQKHQLQARQVAPLTSSFLSDVQSICFVATGNLCSIVQLSFVAACCSVMKLWSLHLTWTSKPQVLLLSITTPTAVAGVRVLPLFVYVSVRFFSAQYLKNWCRKGYQTCHRNVPRWVQEVVYFGVKGHESQNHCQLGSLHSLSAGFFQLVLVNILGSIQLCVLQHDCYDYCS